MSRINRKDIWNRENNNSFISHKYSKNDYSEKRQEILTLLQKIQEDLNPFVPNEIKMRMIKIHLETLLEAVKYYFNVNTQRISRNINKKYKNSTKEIFKFTRFLPQTENTEEIQNEVYKKIQRFIKEMKEQIEYIKIIEEKRFERRKSNESVQNVY